ncbi:WD40-repeat-containing domain protein, partial [Blyttiomyces helicus]
MFAKRGGPAASRAPSSAAANSRSAHPRSRTTSRSSSTSTAPASLKKKRPRPALNSPSSHSLTLERCLGLTTARPSALALHPSPDSALVAYPAGGVVVLYNHRKNKQTSFLVPGSSPSSALPEGGDDDPNDPVPHLDDSQTSLAHALSLESVGSAPASPYSSHGSSFTNKDPSAPATAPRRSVSRTGMGSTGSLLPVKAVACVAFSPDGEFMAVGEAGHQPRIVVWNLKRFTVVSELVGHKFGVLALAFSPNMRYLVSMGYKHDQSVYVWNWKNGAKLAGSKISTPVNALAFDPLGRFFVTVGVRHIKFWSFDANGMLLKSTKQSQKLTMQALDGRFGVLGDHKNSTFVDVDCRRAADGQVYTYCITERGLLTLFNEDRVMEKWVDLKVNGGTSIHTSDKYIACGCTDGIVRLFEPESLKYIITLPKPHPLGVDVASSLVTTGYRTSSIPNAIYPDAVAVRIDAVSEKVTCVYDDRSLFIWDVKESKHVGKYRSFLFHSDCVWGVEMLPPPRPRSVALPAPLPATPDLAEAPSPLPLPADTFATHSSDGTIRLWNVDGGPDAEAWFGRNMYSRETIKILYVGTGSEGKGRGLIGGGGSREAPTTERQPTPPSARRLASDHCALARMDITWRLGIVPGTLECVFMEAHEGEVLSIDFSGEPGDDPSDPLLMATASRDRLIHIFDVRRSFSLLQTLDDHSSSITAVHFAEKGRRLLSCAADKSIIFRGARE